MKKLISTSILILVLFPCIGQSPSKWELSLFYSTPFWSHRYQATNYKLNNGGTLFLNNCSLNLNRRIIQRPKWRMDVGIGVFSQFIRFKNILYYHYFSNYGRCNMSASVSTLTVNFNNDFRLKDVFNRTNYLRIGVSIGTIQLSRESYTATKYPYEQGYSFDRKNKQNELGFAPQIYSRFQLDYLFNLLKTPEERKQKELNAILGVGSAIVDGNAFNRYFIDLRAGISYRW